MLSSIALTACAVLASKGELILNEELVRKAVLETHWSGRMELVRNNLYVDGAHNPQGIQSFIESVNSLYENNPAEDATLLFSVVSDKNYDQMIKILCGCKHFRKVYVTMAGGLRKLSANIIKQAFEAYTTGIDIVVFKSVDDALNRWDNRLMFATGSLYLVGDVVSALERKENNHD